MAAERGRSALGRSVASPSRGPQLAVAGGLRGPAAERPRKYVRGSLRDAYGHRSGVQTGEQEYRSSCKAIGAQPNSKVEGLLKHPGGFAMDPHEFLGGLYVTLRDTYVGERGFIALLPVLDRNLGWTSLDASNNGLRNEAVLHLVDMLLRPQHRDRDLHLDLSVNPFSESGGRALLQLVATHPHIGHVDIRRTKVPRTTALLIRETLRRRHEQRRDICDQCGNLYMMDSQYCRVCGQKRSWEDGEPAGGPPQPAAEQARPALACSTLGTEDHLEDSLSAAGGCAVAELAGGLVEEAAAAATGAAPQAREGSAAVH